MRNGLTVVVVIAVLSSFGCKRGEVSMEVNAETAKFERLMTDGKTTRDQEQRFIQAVSAASLQLDRAIRGTKKAEQTRKNERVSG